MSKRSMQYLRQQERQLAPSITKRSMKGRKRGARNHTLVATQIERTRYLLFPTVQKSGKKNPALEPNRVGRERHRVGAEIEDDDARRALAFAPIDQQIVLSRDR